MTGLYAFDRAVLAEGFPSLAGVDEAGRGPLAGPVYAAAVVLPETPVFEGLNDSKKLTAKKREILFEAITATADWAIARAEVEEIERLNILGASLLAMSRAVEGLQSAPSLLLVDGNTALRADIPARAVVSGDAKSAAIAAASILAKVARDRYMLELDGQYPQYRFAKHKGYGTKLHYEMLDACGPCPAHRSCFLRKWREART